MKHCDGRTIEVIVQTTRGTKSFDFDPTAKVEEVIETVVRTFGFSCGDRAFLALESDTENALEPRRTLVSYGIEDGTVLIFSTIGSGV